MLMKILVLASALLAAPAMAKDLSSEEVHALQAKMRSYDTLTVDFTQTKTSGLRPGKGAKREGKALFTKPNLFKWMLETPTKEYKIYDGKHFFDFNPDSNSAKRYSPTGPQTYELRQIIDLVLNADALLKSYEVVKAEETGDLVKIQLKPKSEGDLVMVELHLNTKEQFVPFLKMDFRNKSSLIHEFRNPSHKAIPESTFELPKTVKITDSN